jgi:hypothetical protein
MMGMLLCLHIAANVNSYSVRNKKFKRRRHLLSTTVFILLNRRTLNRSVAAKYTTISGFWFQAGAATTTVIEMQTGIQRHFFCCFISAERTGNNRIKLNIHLQQSFFRTKMLLKSRHKNCFIDFTTVIIT